MPNFDWQASIEDYDRAKALGDPQFQRRAGDVLDPLDRPPPPGGEEAWVTAQYGRYREWLTQAEQWVLDKDKTMVDKGRTLGQQVVKGLQLTRDAAKAYALPILAEVNQAIDEGNNAFKIGLGGILETVAIIGGLGLGAYILYKLATR